MSTIEEKDKRGLSGLHNLGNTCYMNATLQCLFATDLFNYYLKKKKFKSELRDGVINMEIQKCKDILKLNPHISLDQLIEFINSKKTLLKEKFKSSLTYSMYQVFTIMWNSNCIVKPKNLKDTISKYFPKFEGFNQHDSEELLYAIFERLHDETKSDIKNKRFKVSSEISEYFLKKRELEKKIKLEPNNNSFQDELTKLIKENYNSDVVVRSLEFWKNYLESNNSIITTIFTGLFASDVVCKNCSNKNVNFEAFNILELSLSGEDHKFYNLEDCIKNFCKNEEVENYKCDSCKNTGIAVKRMTIFQLPPKLIIQLKRFNGKNKHKINDLIKFPLNDLDMSIAQNEIKQINKKYNLYATINHSGSLNGGHYVAHCKNLIDKKWYYFNDSSISYVDESDEIIDNSAYVLFYEKA
jgi:ubiquitin C-terminal hydrolase